MVANTSFFSNPKFEEILFTISALVIFNRLIFACEYINLYDKKTIVIFIIFNYINL